MVQILGSLDSDSGPKKNLDTDSDSSTDCVTY